MSDPVRAGAWRVLALLTFVYVFNFLDRTLIFILFGPIRSELGLGEIELALLGSTSFVIFYTLLGVPFGRLADRVNRVHMIAGGLLVWSVFSGLTGFMESFGGLFVCRLMVGVGEATLGPAAVSLLADFFPASRRANANAIFAAGVPVGAGLAMFAGGAIGQDFGWRAAFFLLGFPGVLLAVALLVLVRDPRGEVAPSAVGPAASGGRARRIVTDPAFRLHTLGFALFALASNAVGMWVPSLLGARFDVDLKTVGVAVGICTVGGGLVGSAFGGRLADRWRAQTPGGRLKFCALAAAACAPLWLGLLHAPTFATSVVFLGPLLAAALVWLGPAAADLTEIVPAGQRGLAVGMYYLGVNAVGYGLGPPTIGWVAEQLGSAADPTRVADALLVAPIGCAGAAVVLLVAAWRREGRFGASAAPQASSST